MSDRLKELREKQAKIVADARAILDAIKDDTPEAEAKEAEAKYDKAMAEYDRVERQAEREQKLADREAAINEPDPRRPNADERKTPGTGEDDKRTEAEKRKDAFNAYLRYGADGLTPELRKFLMKDPEKEQRAQGVANPTAGGYLAPDGFMPELVKSMKAWGPMLDPGTVRQMLTATGVSIPWPTMDDTSNEGVEIAENTQVSLSEVSFGVKTINAYKYTSGVVLIASELLQDSALDVEQIIRDAMAERIGRIANRRLTTGDGASRPNGIMTAAGAGATAASATAITFDDLIELEHSVDPAYRTDPSCGWQMNDSTLKALRKLKDGDGNYIWQPADAKTGAPSTILNYRYGINQHIASVATGNKSVVFGAMQKYLYRLVNSFAIRRLVERYADYDQVGFIGFARLDGNLLDAGAVKVLTHP